MSTAQEIRDFKDHGSWRTLAALAAEMVADAERRAGGARMWALTARDLFDWKAVSEHPRYRHISDVVKSVLTPDRQALLVASIEKLSALPEAQKQWDGIRAATTVPLSVAIAWARAEIGSMEAAPMPNGSARN